MPGRTCFPIIRRWKFSDGTWNRVAALFKMRASTGEVYLKAFAAGPRRVPVVHVFRVARLFKSPHTTDRKSHS